MKTTHFLLNYLTDTAMVTICDNHGSILYEGQLGEMPIVTVRGTILVGVHGLGSSKDIIVEVKKG